MNALRYDVAFDLPRLPSGTSSLGVAEKLCQEICCSLMRCLPTSCGQISLEVRAGDTLVLTGYVRTFYARQMLLHLCRSLASGYEVVDALTVDPGTPAWCWTAGAIAT